MMTFIFSFFGFVLGLPIIARIVKNALLKISLSLLEAARVMGTTPMQIIKKVLLSESLPGLLNFAIITLITLVIYSAIASAVGDQ